MLAYTLSVQSVAARQPIHPPGDASAFKTPSSLDPAMAMPPGSPPVPRDNQLYEDSLKLTVNKNIEDIRILLLWAQESDGIRDKIQHSQQALAYLTDVVETLRELHRAN